MALGISGCCISSNRKPQVVLHCGSAAACAMHIGWLQVLDALPELGPYELRLGHTQLFAAAVAGLGLPPGTTAASVMAQLAKAMSVSASRPDAGVQNSSGASGVGGSGTPGTAGGTGGGAASAAAAGAGAAGGAGAGGSSSTSSSSEAAGGRATQWPAVRIGLDGLGLDSKPVSRCRQCVLKLPGAQSVDTASTADWYAAFADTCVKLWWSSCRQCQGLVCSSSTGSAGNNSSHPCFQGTRYMSIQSVFV